MPFGLSADTINLITRQIAENRRVDRIILFGSRAKGNPRPGSDIDLAVSGKALTLQDILDMSVKMDRLELAYKVDIIHHEKTQDPDLRKHIRRVGITLHSGMLLKAASGKVAAIKTLLTLCQMTSTSYMPVFPNLHTYFLTEIIHAPTSRDLDSTKVHSCRCLPCHPPAA